MQAMGLVLKARDHFGLKPADQAEWQQVMSTRLRNLLRAVSQGELKHPTCAWVKQLPWRSETAEPKNDDYFFGFDE
eukprot:3618418-Alexandrium_andersonii.AAC.1